MSLTFEPKHPDGIVCVPEPTWSPLAGLWLPALIVAVCVAALGVLL